MIRTVLLAAVAVFVLAPRAQAHSWYPVGCCSNHDCEMVPAAAVTQRPTGYDVRYISSRFGPINESIPMGMVRSSQTSISTAVGASAVEG